MAKPVHSAVYDETYSSGAASVCDAQDVSTRQIISLSIEPAERRNWRLLIYKICRGGLTDEELAIFDLLTSPEPQLTKAEEQEVKAIACQLLKRLHELVDAVDWLRGQETRVVVWSEIRVRLNELPEQPYPQGIWDAKVEQI